MTPPRAETVETAKRYPFPRPDYSFLFVDGEALPLLSLGESLEEAEIEVDGRAVPAGTLLRRRGIAAPAPLGQRTPVLAYGANAAPERLRRKFAPIGQAVFPVLNAKLHDFDVVHAAHVSSYGAVPATIERSPGTVCDIAITWLDERELATHARDRVSPAHLSLRPAEQYPAGARPAAGHGHGEQLCRRIRSHRA